MTKSGLLTGPINALLSTLGHGHLVMITDCGMPLPESAAVVDLALVRGTPAFAEVLRAVLADLEVEGSVVEDVVRGEGLSPEFVSHQELKSLLDEARLIIRTGEATSYANVALRCGVTF